jgi:NADPH:quinone reductase-like Zn-dependent oxidoreductase
LFKSNRADLIDLKEQIEASKLCSFINRTYPLSEIADACIGSETGRPVGKIVIAIAA